MISKWLGGYDWVLAQPWALLLLLLLPLLIVYSTIRDRNRASVIRISDTSGIEKFPIPVKVRWLPLLTILRGIAFIMFVIVLARPQQLNHSESVDSEGIDIVMSIDISGSMLAEDFKPNRIEAAKATAKEFINGRLSDRIGLVIFAGESFTQCPITIDHQVLKQQLSKIKSGLLDDGTAIGMGLATGVDRLKETTGKSKVVILLTDGVNNTGLIDPLTALEIAKVYGVRVYTIGVGSQGQALYPVQTPTGIQKQMMPVQIDEPLLEKISNETGGKYYRAIDNQSLAKIYEEIDQLERTKVEISAYRQYKELFFWFAFIGVIALLIEILLRHSIFRSLT